MRIATVGDACCDCYLDEGVWYPGGQALNVAVNALHDGAEAAGFLGIVGADQRGQMLRELAAGEGVDLSRCRVVQEPTSYWGVRIVDGDRQFEDRSEECLDELYGLRISGADRTWLGCFDVCHTTNEAGVDVSLERLHKTLPVSYDYSVYAWDDESWVTATAPHIDIAFLSGEREDGTLLDEKDICAFARRLHELGPQLVVCTLGSRGSLCSCAGDLSHAGIVPVEVADTMGAGDSFAAAFLVRWFESRDAAAALSFAAKRAAITCTMHGAWGHPQPLQRNASLV